MSSSLSKENDTVPWATSKDVSLQRYSPATCSNSFLNLTTSGCERLSTPSGNRSTSMTPELIAHPFPLDAMAVSVGRGLSPSSTAATPYKPCISGLQTQSQIHRLAKGSLQEPAGFGTFLITSRRQIQGAEELQLRRMKQHAARRSERLPEAGRQATQQMMG
jgi:hypothetical protein